jgi:hypothetical protein
MAKRTIRRRLRKNRTIRKVMRGCNGRRGRGKRGGATEAVQYSGSGSGANGTLAALQAGAQQAGSDAKAQTPPPIPTQMMSNQMAGSVSSSSTPVVEPFSGGNFSSTYSTYNSQVGGSHHRGRARTRHHKRRLRYKKSVARKSRRS